MSAPRTGPSDAGSSGESVDAFFRYAAAHGRSPGNLRFALQTIYADIELEGTSFLDIGAGDGLHCLYAAAKGARRVVGLEPEAAGSSAGAQETFASAVRELGFDGVELLPVTLQEYEPDGEPFDVILLNSSINHLDEEACLRLHEDAGARALYRGLFEKLAALAAPGAALIAIDCSRRNFFGRLWKNPILPWIEWEKHQTPQLWAKLLTDVGFERPRVRWLTFNTLRAPGRLLLGNRVAAFFLISAFCLTARKGRDAAAG